MQAVLNAPVSPVEMEETGWIRLLRGEAGDPLDDFHGRFVLLDPGDFSPDGEDLSHMGEVEVIIEVVAGPDLADFEAAVRLIDGLVLRGEKRSGSRLRCLP